MAEESKPVKDLREGGEAPAPSGSGKGKEAAESDDESGSEVEAKGSSTAGDDSGKKKKKKSKKSKAKQAISQALSGSGSSADTVKDPKKAIEGLTTQQVNEFMTLNPALADELRAANPNADPAALAEIFKKLRLQDIMTGLATSGKNRKDLGAYKFWATQPVPQFGDEKKDLFEEGPLRVQKIEDIPKEPEKLALEQFRWVTMDLTDEAEMAEVEKLLYGHYVEDDEAMFRFKYSMAILKWCVGPQPQLGPLLTVPAGPCSRPGGKRSGMSGYAAGTPCAPSSLPSPSTSAFATKSSRPPKSTFSAFTRSSAASASRQYSSRRSLVSATLRASSRPSTPEETFSQDPSAHAATTTAPSTGQNSTSAASATSRQTARPSFRCASFTCQNQHRRAGSGR
jgi:hypothetical protein